MYRPKKARIKKNHHTKIMRASRRTYLYAAIVLAAIWAGMYIHGIYADPGVEVNDREAVQAAWNDEEMSRFRAQLEHMPVVTVRGEGYAAGYMHGKLLHDEIQAIMSSLGAAITEEGAGGALARGVLLRKAHQLDDHVPEIYRAEMRGVADGAEVSYNEVLLMNTYDDLLYLAGCSSIAVVRGEKGAPSLVHGRNLDYEVEGLADNTVIIRYPDKDMLAIAFPGYIGVLTGVNGSGITLGSLTSEIEDMKLGIPTGFLYRSVLEKARTIGDVERILIEHKTTIGNNVAVASASENAAAVFETTPTSVTRRDAEGYIAATNHFIANEYAGAQEEMIGISESRDRYADLERFYTEAETLDERAVRLALSDFDGGIEEWTSVANYGTVQSVVFLPGEKTVLVAKGKLPPVTEEGFVRYWYGDL